MASVSIVIPALNEAEGIGNSVQRALALKPEEVIVVDGGSSDETFERARAAGATVLSSPMGRSRQQNLGARQSSGEVVLFLHADCWLAPGSLTQVEEALSDSKVLCGAFRQAIEAEGRLYRLLERGNALRVRLWRLPYGDQGLFFRREFFERLGGFPEVALMEDWLLMRRARKMTRPVLLPGPLHAGARRWQRHGVLRQTVRNWTLLAAARFGVSPDRLAKFYRPHK